MKTPDFPKKELKRLSAVRSYNILDTLPESDYDNITELVASICEAPIAIITFLDEKRNYFKSHYGIPLNESPRDISFCGHAILDDDIMIIEDARKDERFMGNPLLEEQKAIFYAGQPLVDADGFALGTICVFDHKPRTLTNIQKKALKTLSKQVVNLLDLRQNNIRLEKTKVELKNRNKQLKSFASHVSHDLKSPLANIISLTDLLKDENDNNLTDDSILYIDSIKESADILKDYIDGILMHYKTDDLLEVKKENITLSEISEDIKKLLISTNDELIYTEHRIKNINKAALSQILINLVDNALKYNNKSKRTVKIDYEFLDDYHRFSVSDNGIGIAQNQQEHIFEIFKTVKNNFTKNSTGIGLSTVKNLVEKQNGHISVTSEEGKGSTFSFTIAV